MSDLPPAVAAQDLRVEKPVYGGDGLVRTAEDRVVLLPFVLPGERVQLRAGAAGAPAQLVQASPDRVEPRCVHFGVCGGCQYQMASYPAQLGMKTAILEETLQRAGATALPPVQTWASPQPWGYRNRIRLRVREADDGRLRLGYNQRGSETFLPIEMCPIAAPVLLAAAKALEALADRGGDAALWLRSAAEVELFCDAGESSLQVHLLCPKAPRARKGSLPHLAEQLKTSVAPLVSMQASRLQPGSGRAAEVLASWGAGGLRYTVGERRFWLEPGSFFQVNRFLLPRLAELVCGERRGALAWDLFAGAGLFARELATRFDAVTAVEANPVAAAELGRGLRQHPGSTAVAQTTLHFLRDAVVQRDRPELIVLDPPRAGAGADACALLLQLAPETLVYVSCDPPTLARDLAVLSTGYCVADLHMIDLFPQTYHLETVMVLHHRGVAG